MGHASRGGPESRRDRLAGAARGVPGAGGERDPGDRNAEPRRLDLTAGRPVFIASTMDERIRAFDSRTGEELWEARLSAGGYAAPATYRASNGKQYVVIAAGGGGKWGTPSGDAFVGFALED